MTVEPGPITPPGIVAALAKVGAEAGAIPKADQNREQNYAYRGIERILARVGPLLHEHGVVITPRVLSVERTQRERGRDRKLWDQVTLTVQYDLTHIDGSSLTTVVVAEGQDNADKAPSKAMTMAYKVMLLQVLAIGDDENDPDLRTPDDAYARDQRSTGTGASQRSTGTRQRAERSTGQQEPPRPPTRAQIMAAANREHGAEFAAALGALLAKVDEIDDEDERKRTKHALIEAHGSPTEFTPRTLADAERWLDEWVGGTPEAPETEQAEQPASDDEGCECGALIEQGEPHLEGCPHAPF